MMPSQPGPSASPDGRGAEPSALVLVETLIRHWRRVTGFTFGVGVLTAALSLLLPPTYQATFSFFPQAKAGTKLPGSLASLAGQFGVAISDEPTQSPQFYASLLGSRATLQPVLFARFANPDSSQGSDSLSLIDIYRTAGRTPAERTENGLLRLTRSIDASLDALTGIVTVKVSARDPSLAAAIAGRLMQQLNTFNIEARRQQARERLAYAERTSAEAESTLVRAEDALEHFYAGNRQYQSSPSLTFEEQRLRRQVDMAQDLYLNLMRQYQGAEVDEANDVPVLVPIDQPVAPTRRTRPKRRVLVIVAMFLGFATISAVVVIGEYGRRASPEEVARWSEVADAWNAMKRDLRRVLSMRR